jgi:hypothetical protein
LSDTKDISPIAALALPSAGVMAVRTEVETVRLHHHAKTDRRLIGCAILSVGKRA